MQILITISEKGFEMQGLPDNAVQALGVLEMAKTLVLQRTLKQLEGDQPRVLPVPAQALNNLQSVR
jgi:hypothetical protein